LNLLAIALLLGGLALLVVGAELLVRGAASVAVAAGVSPLVVGLTVVAFGTSSPELAASLTAAGTGQPALALGNVVGSNIFNILLILGLAAAITPLAVDRQLLWLDVPVMIAVSLTVWGLAADGRIGRIEGAGLLAVVVGYTVVLAWISRRVPDAVEQQYAAEVEARASTTPAVWVRSIGAVLGGLTMLVLGSRWLVEGAVAIARAMNVSELVVGLTLVAGGTSLPELATSAVAAFRGHRDIAVGNVVGSNVFNLTMVLGTTAVMANRALDVPSDAIAFDLPTMVAVAALCWPLFLTGRAVARWEGGLLLSGYLAYTVWLLLRASAAFA
jgi:cation:H+ antiporter